MNEEARKKYEGCFIPCGDALEKMDLFIDDTSAPEEQDAENPEVSG